MNGKTGLSIFQKSVKNYAPISQLQRRSKLNILFYTDNEYQS